MPVSFAASILPMFRPQDIQCMKARRVKLDDPAWMTDPAAAFGNARHVYAKLSSGAMPPDGPWSQAQLDLFQQWMNDGFNA